MAVGYSSSKLTLHVGDGFEFMKQNQDAFDVIITDSSDPMGKQGMGLGPAGSHGPVAPALPLCPQLICRVEDRGGPELELHRSLLGHSLPNPRPGSPEKGEHTAAQSYKGIGSLEESRVLASARRGPSFLFSLLSAPNRPASGRGMGSSLNPRPRL